MSLILTWLLLTLAWLNPALPGKEKKIKHWAVSQGVSLITGALISTFVIYFFMPPTMWIVTIFLFLLMLLISNALRGWFEIKHSDVILGISGAGVVICILAFLFAGSFYAEDLHKIPEITDAPSGSIAGMISTEHIRTVPKETAEWKADKKIGDFGYKFEIQEAHIQFRDGELKWLVPFEYGDLWKAYKYGDEGTNGYVKVSAEKPNVESERVLGFTMKYIPSGVFGHNLQRHIYFSYPEFYQKESVFQLDNTGKPIYVTMLTRPTIAYTGEVPVGIVVTDTQTGGMNFYDMDSIPAYIERVMDESLTENYLLWWGAYVHGFWNSIFSQQDVKKPTGSLDITTAEGGEKIVNEGLEPDVYLIYGINDKLYWFTSITTSGKDLSMVGYTLTDVITGHTIFYRTEGYFNDIGAAKNVQQHAEVSKVMGFQVSQPIMYIIEGNETWIIPVLASTNEIRAFGIVHGKTGTTFVKEKLDDALVEYRTWLTGSTVKPMEVSKLTDTEDIIATIIIQRGQEKQDIPVYRNTTIIIKT
jgi:hypothetical protein